MQADYVVVGAGISFEYSAYESGLDRFVHPGKGDFVGRDALWPVRSAASPTHSSPWKCTISPTPMPWATTRSNRAAIWGVGRRAETIVAAWAGPWPWPWSARNWRCPATNCT